jgi:hypothetical protein
MRTVMLTLSMVFGLVLVPASLASRSVVFAAPAAQAVQAADSQQAQPPQINVEVNKGGGGRAWYASPIWVAIGVIALVLVVMLIVMAARGGGGGGTTVVRG